MKTGIITALFIMLVNTNLLASGTTLAYTASLPGAQGNWSRGISLPGFDSSLGTLYSATLTFQGSVTQTLQMENPNAFGTSDWLKDMDHLSNFHFTFGDGSPVASAGVPNTQWRSDFSQGGTLAPFDGVVDYSGSSGLTQTSNTSMDVSFGYYSSDLYHFKNFPTVGIDAIFTSGLSNVGVGLDYLNENNIIWHTNDSADLTVTLSYLYNYTPDQVNPPAIPEPSIYAMAVALVVFAATVIARRRQQAWA
jgi:hypothetical protein